ncbi:MAG: DUF1624 domain-containing protein [Thermodesulfobacteriota bacterium]|jgi:uncharacterized membrane protein
MDRTGPAGRRIESIDVVRGLVIALMALDHCRDFLASGADLLAPLDPATTNPLRFFTRFVTHLCAPAFVLLTGVSIRLSLDRGGRSRAAKAGQLAARGLLLIALELTLVREAWYFGGADGSYMLQVIWAIGASMLVSSVFVSAPDWLRLACGLALCLGHNLLDPVVPADLGSLSWLWRLLHEGGAIPVGGDAVLLASYPLLPWVGLMLTGMAAGRLWTRQNTGRKAALAWTGAAMLAAFVLLRWMEAYGEPRGWSVHPEAARTIYSFLGVTKYPPSLQFFLATLGPACLLLALAERPWGRLGAVLSVFGRTPLFFYVSHLYLLHALGVAVALARHGRADWLYTLPYISRPGEGLGVSLPWVYPAWLACLAALYPACLLYGRWRSRSGSFWASIL